MQGVLVIYVAFLKICSLLQTTSASPPLKLTVVLVFRQCQSLSEPDFPIIRSVEPKPGQFHPPPRVFAKLTWTGEKGCRCGHNELLTPVCLTNSCLFCARARSWNLRLIHVVHMCSKVLDYAQFVF
jgi:hypothetical protein